jgi:hypothetical protein
MRKTLIAKKSFRYAGKPLSAGDSFDASSRDARVLTAIGKASHSYQTRVLTTETATQTTSSTATPDTGGDKPKRTYNRRDKASQ